MSKKPDFTSLFASMAEGQRIMVKKASGETKIIETPPSDDVLLAPQEEKLTEAAEQYAEQVFETPEPKTEKPQEEIVAKKGWPKGKKRGPVKALREANKKKYEQIYWEHSTNKEAKLADLFAQHGVSEAGYHKWKRTHKPAPVGAPEVSAPVQHVAFGTKPDAAIQGKLILCSVEKLTGIITEAVASAIQQAVTSGRLKLVDL